MRYVYSFLLILFSLTQCFAAESTIESQYFEALKSLDKVYILAQNIKNEHAKLTALSEIGACKTRFQKDYLAKNYSAMAERLVSLSENIDEILAECDQEELAIEIACCVTDSAEQF